MKAAVGLLALASSLPCVSAQETSAPPQQVSAAPRDVPLPPPPTATAPENAPPAAPLLIPALTVVRIEIMATLNSGVNKIGEHFPIRLAAPILLTDGREVPTGTAGSGDVVHAAKSRFGGKAGELILAARYLDWNSVHIPLRSFSYVAPGQGRDNSNTAAATAILISPVIAMFITGGEVNIPEGTIAYAKTSAPVTLTPPSTAADQLGHAPSTTTADLHIGDQKQ